MIKNNLSADSSSPAHDTSSKSRHDNLAAREHASRTLGVLALFEGKNMTRHVTGLFRVQKTNGTSHVDAHTTTRTAVKFYGRDIILNNTRTPGTVTCTLRLYGAFSDFTKRGACMQTFL